MVRRRRFWIWAAVGTAIVLPTAWFLLKSFSTNKHDVGSFMRIERGMSYSEVTAIVGESSGDHRTGTRSPISLRLDSSEQQPDGSFLQIHYQNWIYDDAIWSIGFAGGIVEEIYYEPRGSPDLITRIWNWVTR